ncbi:hypothetical protein [Peptostreptococcus sp. D1]|uniref:hypothetical protein n=1 Tax=Peptostreptococcus sp. D1 TaxID=72304 RepID=UPI0008DF9AE5|nr:hypothetical protein [Peptostreptococcus sp. D1]SFE22511.1 hypothetical protein SAMN02910278_00322 [Peptostreptococcus sp. D1]
MKFTKRKTIKVMLLTGLVFAGAGVAGLTNSSAAVRYESSPKNSSIEESIDSLKRLTKDEEEQLLKTELELESTWNEISNILKKIDEINLRIFGSDERIAALSDDEYDKLEKKSFDETAELRNKLDELYEIVEKAEAKDEPILQKLDREEGIEY